MHAQFLDSGKNQQEQESEKVPQLYARFIIHLEWRALGQGRSKHISANITQLRTCRHHWNFKLWNKRHYLHSFIHELSSLLNKFPHLKSSPLPSQSKTHLKSTALLPLPCFEASFFPNFQSRFVGRAWRISTVWSRGQKLQERCFQEKSACRDYLRLINKGWCILQQ